MLDDITTRSDTTAEVLAMLPELDEPVERVSEPRRSVSHRRECILHDCDDDATHDAYTGRIHEGPTMKKLAFILSFTVGIIIANTAFAAQPTKACTASNEGEIVSTWNKAHTREETYVCDSGWQLFRVCSNGVCEYY